MNTLNTARTAVQAAEQSHAAAKKRHDDATAAQHELRRKASMSETPVGESFYYERQRAESEVATAAAALGRATRTLTEARASLARLEPHAATLARLDKALAAVAAQDEAISVACLGFYERLASEVRDLYAIIAAADGIWGTLPADVRALDLGIPADRGANWGRAGLVGDLLSLAAVVVHRRLGTFAPPLADTKKPTPRATLGA